MGVRGLQTYLEHHCQSASQFVSIPELLERFSNTRDDEPVIVVDGSSCIRFLYGNLEWVGGGQLKQYGDKATEFVNAFKNLGVRLVFFFDGPTEQRKRNTWVRRRMESMKKSHKVQDFISRGNSATAIHRDDFLLPPGMGQLVRVVFQIICKCEVFQSVVECDEEIAEYARKHNAFAILSQDSDYVIMDKGEALFLSIEKLDLQSMRTRHYDQSALAQQLKIEVEQLPLLATLVGNDIIPSEQLQKFHSQFKRQYLIPALSKFIQTFPMSGKNLEDNLPEISKKVFGNPDRARDILTSILSYSSSPRNDIDQESSSGSTKWVHLLDIARKYHVKNINPSMIYSIMKGLPFESSTVLEDYRLKDLPASALVTLPIRQRLYGILLQEKSLPAGQKEHKIEEWCMSGPGSLDKANYVTAVPPARPHRGLEMLWDGDKQWDQERWELFVHSVDPRLDVEALKTLNPQLVIPTMILFFLKPYLHDWEIEAALATAVCLHQYDTVKLARLPADPIRPRGIRISSLIMRTTFVLYILLAACGYPLTMEQTAPWHFFDGKLFQYKYVAAEQGNKSAYLRECRGATKANFDMASEIIFR